MKYFDLHCDTPYRCFEEGLDFSSLQLAVRCGCENFFEEYNQCFAVWIADDTESPFKKYRQTLDSFKKKLGESGSKIKPVFTVEGGAVLEGNSDNLYTLKNDGIRALTLTWNGKNEIASGVGEIGGLTPFGREAVRLMNSLDIFCDLSHLNKESFYGALDVAKHPFASHSCCDDVFGHRRNLDENQLKELISKGGIIGLCLYPQFLGEGEVFENIYRHLFYLLDKGYENHIAIGSDFDGADMDKSLDSAAKIPSLYLFLEQKGINKGIIDKIFYENAKNFFSPV
ncbi:MAG: membrane dipeptidase [Clostridia bacterium]|nr:membrane dipeptidase [Clostridia bacterium]